MLLLTNSMSLTFEIFPSSERAKEQKISSQISAGIFTHRKRSSKIVVAPIFSKSDFDSKKSDLNYLEVGALV